MLRSNNHQSSGDGEQFQRVQIISPWPHARNLALILLRRDREERGFRSGHKLPNARDRLSNHAIAGKNRKEDDQHSREVTRKDPSLICSLCLLGDGEILGFDFETQSVVCAHIDICDPHQRELRYQKAAPSGIEHLELRQEQKQRRYIVAEAILTGEQVEELSFKEAPAVLAPGLAELARLPEDLLMRNRPCDAGDSQTEQ
jgi:hypothetical protein